MLAGGEDRHRLRMVEMVRRGDVDDIDRIVSQDRVERGIRVTDAEVRGPCGAALRCASENAADLHADATECLHVNGADEARPDHGSADLGDARHASANPRSSMRPI